MLSSFRVRPDSRGTGPGSPPTVRSGHGGARSPDLREPEIMAVQGVRCKCDGDGERERGDGEPKDALISSFPRRRGFQQPNGWSSSDFSIANHSPSQKSLGSRLRGNDEHLAPHSPLPAPGYLPFFPAIHPSMRFSSASSGIEPVSSTASLYSRRSKAG